MAENPPPLMVVYVSSLIFFFTWNYLATLCHIELPTIPVQPGFSGVCVTRSLVLCVCFVDRCLSFCNFSFGHCVVCSSIYGFWLPIWYLQARLTAEKCHSPASCLIGFLSYYSLPGHFLVMIHVSEVDVFSVLCHTKNALKRQRTFRNIKKLHDNVWI
jgi:hypothetical protein